MGCTEVMLRTSITFVCKVDVAVLLGLSVYASTGIVVNRDNPVKRVKDKYLFIYMIIFYIIFL